MEFARNNKTYLGLHVKYPTFLPDFNEILILPTDFRKSPEYQIWAKSVWWDPKGHVDWRRDRRAEAGGWTGGHDAINRRFSRLCKRVYKCLNIIGLRKWTLRINTLQMKIRSWYINNRLKSGNICYDSIHKVFVFRFPIQKYKDLKYT